MNALVLAEVSRPAMYGLSTAIIVMELEYVVYQVRLAPLVTSGLMRCHDLLVQCHNPLAGTPNTRRVE